MLLRSSSTPIFNSWLSSSREPSLDSDVSFAKLSRTRSISFALSWSFSFDDHPIPKSKTQPDIQKPKRGNGQPMLRISSSSGLSTETAMHVDEEGGGKGFRSQEDSHSTDVYYGNMIEANPGNALLLANYAKFLKEVKRDYWKAEEYCGRAILTSPTDGNLLSLYADLIWHAHKDANRAETYYDQAVKTNPDDCYVLASYARFLWDAEEEDDDEDEDSNKGKDKSLPPPMFLGCERPTHHLSPLTAS